MTSPGVAPSGHGTPSACAESRSRSTSRGSASGRVRTMPDAAVQHEPRGAHAGEQRDLRVPLLDRQRRAAAQGPHPVGPLLDHLLRGRQRDPATCPLGRLPEDADLPQEPQRLVRGAVVERRLRARVRQLCAAPYRGSPHVDVDRRAVGVEVDRPQQGRRHLVRQQARDALRQHRRVQRRAAVRGVQGLDAFARLVVDRAARAPPTRRRRRSRTAPGTRRRGARCGPPGPGPSSPRGRW